MSRDELRNTIWRACDIMRSDGGTAGILQYMEQLSWLLFLKAFEAIEERHEAEAALRRARHERVLPPEYHWSTWARKDWPAEELVRFVNETLLPYLRNLRDGEEKETVATIFRKVRGVLLESPYNFKDVVALIDQVDFQNAEDTHVVSQVYEDLLLKMGQQGGIAGEYYTPRPIIRLMVKIVDPKVGERALDPFCGSAGFLIESFQYMKERKDLKAADLEKLQTATFHGQEKTGHGYLLGIINMLLHGITVPHMRLTNTLEQDVRRFSPTERFEVILTNPPFGGKEGKHIQQNFPVQANATELLALQHVMKRLKPGGRCAIVVPEGILFRGGAFAAVRKELLEEYNLHTVVSLPSGVFANVAASGSGPKTDLLFFERGKPTKEIWYYEVEGKFTRARPIGDENLADCLAKCQKREVSERSWVERAEAVVERDYDLTARNPNKTAHEDTREPEEIVKGLQERGRTMQQLLTDIRSLL